MPRTRGTGRNSGTWIWTRSCLSDAPDFLPLRVLSPDAWDLFTIVRIVGNKLPHGYCLSLLPGIWPRWVHEEKQTSGLSKLQAGPALRRSLEGLWSPNACGIPGGVVQDTRVGGVVGGIKERLLLDKRIIRFE